MTPIEVTPSVIKGSVLRAQMMPSARAVILRRTLSDASMETAVSVRGRVLCTDSIKTANPRPFHSSATGAHHACDLRIVYLSASGWIAAVSVLISAFSSSSVA